MKRIFLFLFLLIPSLSASAEPLFWDSFEQQSSEPLNITVYRSPSCQCCERWIAHLEKHNFIVDDKVVMNTYDVKEAVELPKKLASCHTAIIGDYVIEGHVPANDIKALVSIKPDLASLAVPQMPHGTPGMETGVRNDDFIVIGFTKQEKVRIFSSYKHTSNGQYKKLE